MFMTLTVVLQALVSLSFAKVSVGAVKSVCFCAGSQQFWGWRCSAFDQRLAVSVNWPQQPWGSVALFEGHRAQSPAAHHKGNAADQLQRAVGVPGSLCSSGREEV